VFTPVNINVPAPVLVILAAAPPPDMIPLTVASPDGTSIVYAPFGAGIFVETFCPGLRVSCAQAPAVHATPMDSIMIVLLNRFDLLVFILLNINVLCYFYFLFYPPCPNRLTSSTKKIPKATAPVSINISIRTARAQFTNDAGSSSLLRKAHPKSITIFNTGVIVTSNIANHCLTLTISFLSKPSGVSSIHFLNMAYFDLLNDDYNSSMYQNCAVKFESKSRIIYEKRKKLVPNEKVGTNFFSQYE
jgi:hypothetical protein